MKSETRRPVKRSLALVGLACIAARCAAPPVLLSPRDGALLTAMPQPLEVRLLARVNPATLTVTLDGVDVTAAFEERGPSPQDERYVRFVAEAFWVPALMGEGEHRLRAEVEDGGRVRAREVRFELRGDPFADAVHALALGVQGGFGGSAAVLGPPRGDGAFSGSLDVLSLGVGGAIELAFEDHVVFDGPGPDFIVFENPILELVGLETGAPFSEPARVSVSADGVSWTAFPCELELAAAPLFPGCAGIYPVFASADDPATPHASVPTLAPVEALIGRSLLEFEPPGGAGGDLFDLADVGLAYARFVRIEAAPFALPPVGADNAGFDLDAVAAIHAVPPDDADADGVPDALTRRA